eukprot:gene7383-13130_t
MDFHSQSDNVLNEDEIKAIDKLTIGQASNCYWKQQRMYGITASKFYSAAVNTVEPSSKLIPWTIQPSLLHQLNMEDIMSHMINRVDHKSNHALWELNNHHFVEKHPES